MKYKSVVEARRAWGAYLEKCWLEGVTPTRQEFLDWCEEHVPQAIKRAWFHQVTREDQKRNKS